MHRPTSEILRNGKLPQLGHIVWSITYCWCHRKVIECKIDKSWKWDKTLASHHDFSEEWSWLEHRIGKYKKIKRIPSLMRSISQTIPSFILIQQQPFRKIYPYHPSSSSCLTQLYLPIENIQSHTKANEVYRDFATVSRALKNGRQLNSSSESIRTLPHH